MLLALLLVTHAPDHKFVRSVIAAAARVLPFDTRVEAVEHVPSRLPQAPYKLSVVPLSTRLYGPVPAKVVATRGEEKTEFQVVLRLVYDRPVVRLARNVAPGTILTSDALQQTTEEVRDSAPAPAGDLARVVGKKLRGTGRAGQAVFERDVETPPVFAARTRVTLIARTAGVRVSAPAESQEVGTLGAQVRVMNLLSKRLVVARVIDAGTVEIVQ